MSEKTEIFLNLISFLKKENIDYAVLGNTTSFPYVIGSDVDIVVTEQSFKTSDNWIKQFCNEFEYTICNYLQHEIKAKSFVVAKINPKNLLTTFIAIDVCSDYYRDGRLLINYCSLLENKIVFTTSEDIECAFNIPNDRIAFIYYFIKKIEKNSFNEEQIQYLSKTFSSERELLQLELRNIFSQKHANLIFDIFIKKQFSRLTPSFLNELKVFLLKKFRITIKDQFSELLRNLKRIVKPTGIWIAFMGCDGAGKSTLINLLNGENFPEQAFRKSAYFHLYPSYSANKVGQVLPNPHDQIKRSSLLSNIKVIYLFFRYTAGYWIIIYPKRIKSTLVIFDRYYHDLLVDQIRYRHGGGLALAKLVGNLMPKPELFFFIDAPVKTILSRKQEVPYEEVKRQKNEYLLMAKKMDNGYVIDNSHDPKTGVFSIEEIIVNYLNRRHKKRTYKHEK